MIRHPALTASSRALHAAWDKIRGLYPNLDQATSDAIESRLCRFDVDLDLPIANRGERRRSPDVPSARASLHMCADGPQPRKSRQSASHIIADNFRLSVSTRFVVTVEHHRVLGVRDAQRVESEAVGGDPLPAEETWRRCHRS